MGSPHRRHAHHHGHRGHGGTDDAAMAELLDLDAEVLHTYLSDLTAWVHELAADLPRPRILDLGSGTGTGTVALLRRFAGSEAVALDRSAYLLQRLADRARALGLADRVRTVQADVDAGWPDVGTVDMVWASSSLHHLADPDRVLTELLSALHPGGLLAVVEMDAFPRFLPDDVGLGRPGLEARCHAAVTQEMAHELPHRGSEWGSHLSRAGFTVEAERSFVIDLTRPLPAAAGAYAQACLRRLRSGLDGRLAADDLAVLDALLDGDGPAAVLRRDDLRVRTTRTAWVARRP